MSAAPPAFDPYRDWLRITAPERPVDHYTLLGLPRFTADATQIGTAADQRLAAIFPLVQGPYGGYAQALFNEIANAKATLLQPVAKQAYDAELWRRTSAPVAATPATAEGLLPPTAPPTAPPVVRRSTTTAKTPEPAAELALPWHAQLRVRIAAGIVVILLLTGVGAVVGRGWFNAGEPTANPNLAEVAESTDEVPDDMPAETPPPQPDVVLRQEGSGDVNFTAAVARINGAAERQVVGTDTVLGGWSDLTTQFEWDFILAKPDVFQLKLIYANEEDWADAKVTVEIDGERRSFETRASGGLEKFITDSKFIPVKKGGKHRLTVFATEMPGAEVMILKAVRLVPTKQSAPNAP